MIDCLKSVLHGFLIGIANIIPGVSGGSMALALGVYERLISAVGCFGGSTFRATFGLFRFNDDTKRRFSEEWRSIDGTFLSCIAMGGAFAVLLFSKLIVWLLQFYHDPTYGFFSGLILVSILIPIKMIRKIGLPECLSAFSAVAFVLLLTLSVDSDQQLLDANQKVEMKRSAIEQDQKETSGQIHLSLSRAQLGRLVFFVLCGAIAISAMVLPGISGSFIMILLGVYFEILQAVNELNMLVIVLFSFGCVLGLLIFTRLLKKLLERYHDSTISFLTGLMVGSLVGLWPFREFTVFGDEKVGFERVDHGWIIPPVDNNTFVTLVAFLVGSGLVVFFLKFNQVKTQKKGS